MTMGATIEAVGGALAAIDPGPTKQRLDAIETEEAELAAAVERGRAELNEATEAAQRARRDGPDRYAAGSAMLAGTDVLDVAKAPDQLQQRRDLLAAGLRDLRERQNGLSARRRYERDQLAVALGEAAAPLAEALEEEALRLAKRLAATFAAAAAVGDGCNSGPAQRLRDALAHAIAELGEARLIGPADLQAPLEVMNALDLAGDALSTARRTPSATTPMPSVRSGLMMAAAMMRQ